MYKKVRLDVHGLKLLTTDNTFATDANTAFCRPFLCGDVICLGGIATIDLRGTKFHLKVWFLKLFCPLKLFVLTHLFPLHPFSTP